MTQPPVTVVGGGLAGLVAAIACAEGGAEVNLYEAHATLGGRWRATTGDYIAHQGPHVLYNNGPLWNWLADHHLLDVRGVPASALAGFWFRRDGRLRRTLPLGVIKLLADRRRPAPVADSYRDWATRHYGAEAARVASNMAGVVAFDADPGRLSAAFVAERLRRAFSFPGRRPLRGRRLEPADRPAGRLRPRPRRTHRGGSSDRGAPRFPGDHRHLAGRSPDVAARAGDSRGAQWSHRAPRCGRAGPPG